MRACTIQAFRTFTLTAIAAFAPVLSHAAVQNRVARINSSNRVALPNTIPARARRATDLGAAPADRMLTSVTLRFSMTAAQQAALSQLLLDQQNPSSPQYHQWLTPEQFGAQFGLSSSDIAEVSAWLTAQGLTVSGTSPSNNFVTVSGTVAQVQQALGTSIHSVLLNGVQHIANLTDPVLPSAVAGVVSTITGLNDFHPKPRIRSNMVRPAFTSSQTGNHYVAPGDFYTIYDLLPLLNSGINGSGVTVAVMGQVDISTSDVSAFRSASGLAANTPTVRLFGTDPGSPTGACLGSNAPGYCTVTAGDLSEAQIDTEWAGAAAPGASILYVNSTDVINGSLMNAITSNVAPILSISYGACEDTTGVNGFTQQQINSMDQLFQQANAQGQTIVSAAGDAGATDCDGDAGNYPAVLGLSVDFPASSPHVTGMGGTMFNDGTATGATSYWSASDTLYNGSALSYIPELPWNETSSSNGLGASGGGASIFFTKPSWQSGTGVPSDGARDVPDISFNAASQHDGYLYCALGYCVNGFRYTDSTLTEAGGTSFGAPTFAGVLALLEQKTGTRLGNVNPTIYALANSTYYNNAFHDVTSGNNNSPCNAGTVNCPSGTSSIGFTAGVGYDQATGWGSLNIFNFVNEWGQVTALGSGTTNGNRSVVSVTAAPSTTVTAGNAMTLNTTVGSGLTGLTSAPTGTVSVLVDNTANGSATTLTNGAATYSLNTTSLTSGTHTVTVNYSGDNVFAASSGTLLINTTSATAADFTLVSSTASVTATSGATSTPATFTITPANGFTGSVAFTAALPASLAATGSFTVSPVVITTAAGSTVFTLVTNKSTTQTTTVLPNLHVAQTPPTTPALQMHLFTAGGGVALASLLFFGLPRRRRFASLLGIFLSIAALSTIGCSSSVSAGSSSSSGSGTSGGSGSGTSTSTTITTTSTANASRGSYIITVTATSAGIEHSSNVTLVVQ